MKILKYTAFLLGLTFVATACSRDEPTVENPTTTPKAPNDFVWKAMNSWYYWQKQVPLLGDNYFKNQTEYANFINGKTPDKLFYGLLYNYGTTDKFSWIENDGTLVAHTAKIAEVEKISGVDYTLFPKDNGGVNFVALVNYVVPNSPADQAGLKRGDVITHVNGALLTNSNADALFSESYAVTVAESVSVTTSGVVTSGVRLQAQIHQASMDENPIAFYKKYTLGGKNIGYLVLNAFKSDYNDELNAIFGQMKNDQISELVLDLRYNGGGSLDTALALAQMLTGSYTGQPYIYMDWNDKHNDWDSFEYLSSKVNIYNLVDNYPKFQHQEEINSLHLSRLHVLTFIGTASASELTIDALSQYIPVQTIGYTTYGKFVGSISLWDSPGDNYLSRDNRSTEHQWMLQPITFAYYNKNKLPHPASGGITPTMPTNPYSMLGNIKEFGNTSDPDLKLALETISGVAITGKSASTSFVPGNPKQIKDKRTLNQLATKLNIDDGKRFAAKFGKP
ncbi:S41 family peptidase [Bergeyella sp. RCAD1439]|uniref:S41 family peptidase n=1 Tax=Bergeyella anatis TaxID=3113737 RepID=UPI002E199369|nr:S41 family peptidase [Bergeyella sp. RCAD1439]